MTTTTKTTMAYNTAGQAGLAAKIQGLREAKAAFQAMPEVFRDRLLQATETTASETVRDARARVLASPSVKTRRLYDAITYRVTQTNGRAKVGISNVAFPDTRGFVDRPARRAHFIEFGTRRQPAEPFMLPAVEGQKPLYLQRCQAAGKEAERDLAGGRFQ
jgi:HK97 gp10 family phage protein